MKDDSVTPTLREIADAAGVSIASVSKVLNNRGGVGEDSRLKVLSIAEQLGYQGNRSARYLQKAGISSAVLVVPSSYYSGSHFYDGVVRGVLDEATANSLKLDVHLVPHDEENMFQALDEILELSAGQALIAIGLNDATLIDRVARHGSPAVLINSMDRTMRLDSVLPDNWCAGWLATRHLLDAGHRRIMHVTLPRRLTMQRRLEGFKVALEEAGIRFDPDVHVIDLAAMGYSELEAQFAMRKAKEQGRLADVTAFFCSMDVVALGVMQGLQSEGLNVPTDISVIGVDDVAIATHSRPPLTTIRIDRQSLGRTGVQLLMRRIAEPAIGASRVNLGVSLIERSTVASFSG